MNSNDSTEFWSLTWQQLDTGPATLDLRRSVSRERLRMAIVVATEALVVVGTLAFATVLVVREPSVEGVLWIGALLVFFAATIAFTVWNRSGLWNATAETTAAYVALRIDPCCARILAARFALVLVIVESLFVLGWHFVSSWLEGLTVPANLARTLLLLAGANAAVLLFAHHHQRRAERELEQLRRIRAALSGPAP